MVLGCFRSLLDRFRSFYIVLGRFSSFLTLVSTVNGYESGVTAINCGVPQGSVLGPLLFLLHISNLNRATKFCKVHYFADNTNLLCLSNSIKKLNKLVNSDLKAH